MNYKKTSGLIVGSGIAVVCDQALKMWIKDTLLVKGSYAVTSFLTMVYTWNPGISFGLFPCYSPFSRYFLLAVSSFFIGLLIVWYYKATILWQEIALIMIVGGAIGNALDRFRLGAVFDFIRFHWHGWDFPAFNLADMLITMGFLALMGEYFQWRNLISVKK